MLAPELLRRRLLRQDQPIPLWIDLDDAEGKAPSDQGAHRVRNARLIRIDRADRSQLRERDEASQPEVKEDAAAVRVDDRRVDDLPGWDPRAARPSR